MEAGTPGHFDNGSYRVIRIGRNLIGARGLVTSFAVFSLLPAGCSKTQTTQEALDAQFKVLKVGQATLAKFAGKVTIDGQPPAPPRGQALRIILFDRKNLDKNKRPLSAACQKDGRFEFYTYAKADGAPVGSYVVLFAELTNNRARGFVQPDGLKNLYDDPDKNAQNPEFVVELAPPGRTDYSFNLEFAGKDPATPGPHAVTEILKN
jgi:hypothetical protein